MQMKTFFQCLKVKITWIIDVRRMIAHLIAMVIIKRIVVIEALGSIV